MVSVPLKDNRQQNARRRRGNYHTYRPALLLRQVGERQLVCIQLANLAPFMQIKLHISLLDPAYWQAMSSTNKWPSFIGPAFACHVSYGVHGKGASKPDEASTKESYLQGQEKRTLVRHVDVSPEVKCVQQPHTSAQQRQYTFKAFPTDALIRSASTVCTVSPSMQQALQPLERKHHLSFRRCSQFLRNLLQFKPLGYCAVKLRVLLSVLSTPEFREQCRSCVLVIDPLECLQCARLSCCFRSNASPRWASKPWPKHVL